MNETLQTIRVIAAVIRRDDLWLLGLRPSQKRHGGLWVFPGGKYEMGETAFDAANRELQEEMGVEVLGVGEVMFEFQDPGSPFLIEFRAVWIDGDPKPLEHERIGWFDLQQMSSISLAPTDQKFTEYLRSLRNGSE